jgi:hypothetical protein
MIMNGAEGAMDKRARPVVVRRREVGFRAVVEVPDVVDGHKIPCDVGLEKHGHLGLPVAAIRWRGVSPDDQSPRAESP